MADFGHATAKAQDQEARDYALKTLRLPPSLKHLKSQFENNKKTNAFDTEFIEQLHKLDSNRDFCKEQCMEEETILHQETLGETNEEVSEDHMEEDHFWRTVKGRKPQQPIQRQQNTKYQQLPQRNKPAITCSPILSQKQSINIQHPFPIQLPKPFLNEHTSNYSVPNDGIVPGGRLTRFLESWKQTILHPWPVSVLQHGYKIQFAKTPVPWRSVPMKMSTADKLAVNEAISKFLEAGIVERPPTQGKGFLSNFFTIQEAKKRGPILNCQKLNQFLQYEHFKMEEVPALREILEKNDYMYKIDLKDAYVMVPIHPHSKKILTFQNEGVVYQYPSLAFGLSIAPQIFSKLMKYAIEPLRKEGIRLVFYLDDSCILSKNKEDMQKTTSRVLNHLQYLGFIINTQKSFLIPNQSQEFLGFNFNSKKMLISVPQQKITKSLQRIKQAQQTQITCSCRWVASLLGKMAVMVPAIGEALLHIRYLQRDLRRTVPHWKS